MKNFTSLSTHLTSKCVMPDVDFQDLHGTSVIFNSESMYYFYKDKKYRDYVQHSNHIFIDGIFVIIACFLLRITGVKRFHGPDLINALYENGLLKNSILVGGHPNNASLVDKGVFREWIDLPFTNSISELNFQYHRFVSDYDYNVIVVSLGLPKQELFSKALYSSLANKNTLIIPAGAAIDFLTGVKIRSSLIWRKCGLEWLPRLFREPRMFIRNVRSLYGFILFLIYK